jgi:hypothetical protein
MSKTDLPLPVCPYCNAEAKLADDREVYGNSRGGKVWRCAPCAAWVPVYRGSPKNKPMGRLAKAPLRRLRGRANSIFGEMVHAGMEYQGWTQQKAREVATRWLASQMGISVGDCQPGFFDEEQALRMIAICESLVRAKQEAA